MSSTRYAAENSAIQQQRWASNPDLSTSVSALMAAKRIALVPDPKLRELLWFIQWRSLEPRGLRQLVDELVSRFPERISTRAMRRFRLASGNKLTRKQTAEVRKEFPSTDHFPLRGEKVEVWGFTNDVEYELNENSPRHYSTDDFVAKLRSHAENLHEHLMQLCVNPDLRLDRRNPTRYEEDAAGVWYFDDLLAALQQLRTSNADECDSLADTEANRQINAALDFCMRRRRMVLIEGKAGIGKTAAVKDWCNRLGGLGRYVEVPSSNDDRSFFAAIAESLGVARGTSYNGQQIKLRVEDALRASSLMLVFDEAQFLWPQYVRPQGIPARMQWIKTAFDSGTAIALVALPKFSDWQQLYAKRTLWDDDQLERRLNRKVVLPDAHPKDDLMKIARARHPNGDKASWTFLTGYALAATKKQASAITEALESAIDIAQQDGRDRITYEDIEGAVHLDFKPAPLKQVESHSINSDPARLLHRRCKRNSEPLQHASSRLTALQTTLTR